MRHAVYILVLILCGCARRSTVDYYNAFVSEYEARFGHTPDIETPIRFVDDLASDDKEAIATCTGSEVLVVRAAWGGLGDEQREELIYHELGHCLLYESHRPDSIMSPSLLELSVYRDRREELINELFDGGNGK